jgi:hypothetical protein
MGKAGRYWWPFIFPLHGGPSDGNKGRQVMDTIEEYARHGWECATHCKPLSVCGCAEINYLDRLDSELYARLGEVTDTRLRVEPAAIVEVFSTWLADNGLAIVNDAQEIIEI